MQHPKKRWLQLALQKLQVPSLSTYASVLRTLARYLPLNKLPLQQQLEDALASFSDSVSAGRIWTAVSALTWAHKLHLLPQLDLEIFRSIARGIDAKAPPVIRQLWFHPSDLSLLSNLDADFEAAALLSYDLMLRSGQLDLLQCYDLDFSTKSIWCPPHKGVRFPYLRAPQQHIWEKLVTVHANRSPTQHLFKRKAREYSNILGSLTEKAFQTRFTWHTLRRGGATTRAHRGESAESIRRFGCWGSEKAVTHYVFPWSDLPLRHWRSVEPNPSASTSTSLPTPKPNQKQCRQPSRRSVHHQSRHSDDRPHP